MAVDQANGFGEEKVGVWFKRYTRCTKKKKKNSPTWMWSRITNIKKYLKGKFPSIPLNARSVVMPQMFTESEISAPLRLKGRRKGTSTRKYQE